MLATGGGSVKSRKRATVFPLVALSFIDDHQLHARSVIKNAVALKHRRVKFWKRTAVERNPLYEEIADVIIHADDQSVK